VTLKTLTPDLSSGLYGVVTAFHHEVYTVSTTGLFVSYTRYSASVASEHMYAVRL